MSFRREPSLTSPASLIESNAPPVSALPKVESHGLTEPEREIAPRAEPVPVLHQDVPSISNPPPMALPVLLDVVVVDAQNRPATDLQQGDFEVRENGELQKVTLFSRERTPISIELLIDTSGSIAGKLKKIEEAGASIIRQSQPGDEFSVIEFKANTQVIQDFTTNVSEAVAALNRLKAGGQTALLDAAKSAVQHANSRARNQRRAVVLITDGDERDSRCDRGEVLNVFRVANVQVYAIGFPDGLPEIPTGRHPQVIGNEVAGESRAKELLNELSHVSGGRAFYPRGTEELDGIAEVISTELRTQYQIGYYSTRPLNQNEWREVKVEAVRGGEHLAARTRTGYIAATIQWSESLKHLHHSSFSHAF